MAIDYNDPEKAARTARPLATPRRRRRIDARGACRVLRLHTKWPKSGANPEVAHGLHTLDRGKGLKI
jgi:hypothetical protein